MKKILFALFVISALWLIGCSHIDDYLERKMLDKSGVIEGEDYQQYQQLSEENRLDASGYYFEETEEKVEDKGKIHVTFSRNNNLEVKYYINSTSNAPVDQMDCTVNPGDIIYAMVSVSDEQHLDMFYPSELKVYAYKPDQGRTNLDALTSSIDNGMGKVIIPHEFEETELSIEPISTYHPKSLLFQDYYEDNSGTLKELDGTWFVNDRISEENSITINPLSSYIISYKFNSDEFFYLSSEPECFYKNNTDGIVIFKQREPNDPLTDYKVTLHEYISVSLVSDTDRVVYLNGSEEEIAVEKNAELTIPKLRYGQQVTISTNKVWPDLDKNRDLILTSEGREDGRYKYTLIVPEKEGEFIFNPAEYTYEHGTIAFTCFGNVVTGPQVLARGSRIFYEQETAEEGYWLSPGDNCVIVGDESETRQQLNDIHFTKKVQVTVALEKPAYGGSITYSVDGNRIYTDTYSTYSGTEIEMQFDPWEGWITNNAHDGDKYIVTDSKSQIIRVNGNAISNVFTEDKEHMPALTVTLEKSVGTDMEFSVRASGYNTSIVQYGGGWKVQDIFDKNSGNYHIITNSQDIISQQIIGTEVPIEMTMGKKALQSNQAVRFVIEKTDRSDIVESETRYITDMTAVLDPIYIYEPDLIGTSDKWYKYVHITIGIVDIERFILPDQIDHATFAVRNMLTNQMMEGGELIEPSEKVAITIEPDEGYYISGKNVSDNSYQDVMKYSNFLTNIADIIAAHPVGRYYTISLSKDDSFAKYTYKLDGKDVEGTIAAKEGQKLTLKYEITDDSYRLEEGTRGIFGLRKSYSKTEKELIITEDFDGKVVTKEDFGIKVIRGDE